MSSKATSSFDTLVQVWATFTSYMDTLVLCCAVDLSIADILHAANKPLSLSAIAANISPSPPSDHSHLYRIMRFLVRKGFFVKSAAGSEVVYDLTPLSKWLIKSTKPTLAPLAALHITNFGNSSGPLLSKCVLTGETPFKLANGEDLYTKLSTVPASSSAAFHEAMACTTEVTMEALWDAYGDRFAQLRSITDVGGGIGAALREIVTRFPKIRGLNFDMPHVVAEAPECDGVTHVGGDMFVDDIPPADAVFMKWILHCFQDEDCVKILKNCKKALPEKGGKIIILEMIISDEPGMADDLKVAMDITMLMNSGGLERTEEEWKKLLKLAGFPRYKIIQIPALSSIIEAYTF